MPEIHLTSEALACLRAKSGEVKAQDLGDGTFVLDIPEDQFRLLGLVALEGETASDVIIRMWGIRHGYH